MNALRLLIDTRDPLMRRGIILSALGALLSTVPLAAFAVAMGRALAGAVDERSLALLLAVVLLSGFAQMVVAGNAGRAVREALAERAEQLRVQAIERLRSAPIRALSYVEPGEAVHALTSSLDDAQAAIALGFDAIWEGMMVALLALAIVFAVDWRLGLAAFVTLPFALPAAYISLGNSKVASRHFTRARSLGTTRILEYIDAIPLLRAFGCTAERARRFHAAIELMRIRMFEVNVVPIPTTVMALFAIEFGFIITLLAGVFLAVRHQMTAAHYVLGLAVAIRYFQSLADAFDGYLRVRDAAGNLHRLQEVLELPALTMESSQIAPLSHDVVLDRLSFSFDRGRVLHDVSARFEPSGVTAIVGRSGAGKSALAGVLAGLWDPDGGHVRIGGVDLWSMPAELRSQTVAYVFQDTYLFEDTVLANVLAARPDASESEAREAARTASCDEFIERLPQGYQTRLRSGGANLSLGERQRIAIARAILSNAPVMLFDESTASLDPATELALHRAIELLARRKTIVLITHRLGTVRNASQIVVLKEGRVDATGTHDALLAAGGEYAELWSAYERARVWSLS